MAEEGARPWGKVAPAPMLGGTQQLPLFEDRGVGLAGERGEQHPPTTLGTETTSFCREGRKSCTRLPQSDRSRTSKNNRWWHCSEGQPVETMRSDTTAGGCGSCQPPVATAPQGRGLRHARAPGGLLGTC